MFVHLGCWLLHLMTEKGQNSIDGGRNIKIRPSNLYNTVPYFNYKHINYPIFKKNNLQVDPKFTGQN